MASLFPYNQISQIPTKLLDSIQPQLTAKTEELSKLTTNLQNKLLSLLPNASCDDSDILDLKTQLRDVQDTIIQVQTIYQFLPILTGAFRFFINLATTLFNIQIVIPTVPGVPGGPLSQNLIALSELVTISSSCIDCLSNSVEIVNVFLDKTSKVTAQTGRTINDICNGAVNTNSPDTTLLSENTTLTILEQAYPSDFYRKVNVSDEDLQQRFNFIQDSILKQIDVISSLNEAPSKVLYGSGVPTSDIGQLGDYYIDTTDQTIYGPKTDSSSWL